MLASVDGAIGPADEARIPVTDEGLLRGDGAFEAMRLYGGRPFALEEHLARLAALVRRPAPGARPRRAARRGRGAARARPGRSRASCGSCSRAAGAGSRWSSRSRSHAPLARVATVRYAPNRVLDGLKTLSYAGNMLAKRLAQGGRLRRGAARHARTAACSRARRRSFFWVRDGALLHAAAGGPDPGLDHPRSGCIAATGAVEEPCTLDDLQARRGGVHRLDRARGAADRRDRRAASCRRRRGR